MSQSAPSLLHGLAQAHLGRKATAATGEYTPVINPEDFVPEINNKYFTVKTASNSRQK
jgi:hypothetical protein